MRRSAQSFPTQTNWSQSVISFKSPTRYVGELLTSGLCYCLIYVLFPAASLLSSTYCGAVESVKFSDDLHIFLIHGFIEGKYSTCHANMKKPLNIIEPSLKAHRL